MEILMAYSGTYKVKNQSKYRGNADKIVYRSMWERHCMKHFDNDSTVVKWSSEEVVVPYFYDVDKRMHRYFVDFLVTYENGTTLLIEVKPKKETTVPEYKGKKTKKYISESMTYVQNANKWKAANEYAKDRKWEFVVWTEDTLYAMGIMKKGYKPLKPLKKLGKKTINRSKTNTRNKNG